MISHIHISTVASSKQATPEVTSNLVNSLGIFLTEMGGWIQRVPGRLQLPWAWCGSCWWWEQCEQWAKWASGWRHFSKGDLRALVEGSPSRGSRQAASSLPIFTASLSKWAFLETLQLTDPGVWCHEHGNSCLEFLGPWQWCDWTKPDEYDQRAGWLEKKGFV